MGERHITRNLLVGTAAVVAGVAAGAAGAFVGGVALARRAVTPSRAPYTPVEVLEVFRRDGSLFVRLRGTDTALPGRYSLIFDGERGHARLGALQQDSARDSVVREVAEVPSGTLAPGGTGRIAGWWFTEPEELGFRTERITYPTELGDAEAWIVHPRVPRKRRWAVHVHGRGGRPAETLRGVPPFARAGVTSLIISYRNDPGAPAGENGRYGNGLSESRDVDAAIAEALRRGAERITLFGWSMGGTASLVAATRGAHRAHLDGVVLDSPAIDWRDLLYYQARRMRVPRPIADAGMTLLSEGRVRSGELDRLPIDALSATTFAAGLHVPTLIHASTGDTFVPCAGSEHLAELRPDMVQLHLHEVAEHVKIWNMSPEPWERSITQFVKALPRPAWRG